MRSRPVERLCAPPSPLTPRASRRRPPPAQLGGCARRLDLRSPEQPCTRCGGAARSWPERLSSGGLDFRDGNFRLVASPTRARDVSRWSSSSRGYSGHTEGPPSGAGAIDDARAGGPAAQMLGGAGADGHRPLRGETAAEFACEAQVDAQGGKMLAEAATTGEGAAHGGARNIGPAGRGCDGSAGAVPAPKLPPGDPTTLPHSPLLPRPAPPHTTSQPHPPPAPLPAQPPAPLTPRRAGAARAPRHRGGRGPAPRRTPARRVRGRAHEVGHDAAGHRAGAAAPPRAEEGGHAARRAPRRAAPGVPTAAPVPAAPVPAAPVPAAPAGPIAAPPPLPRRCKEAMRVTLRTQTLVARLTAGRAWGRPSLTTASHLAPWARY